MCDVAYVLMRDQHERVALAVAERVEDPYAYVREALDDFDKWLASPPDGVEDEQVQRRITELLEEAA